MLLHTIKKVIERGFKGNGTRIFADLTDFRGFCPRKLLNGNIFSHEPIRPIRANPCYISLNLRFFPAMPRSLCASV
ncbi:MAG: hypothetical protein FWG87_01200 [Defluviitaleaceae bacterium]|nr:hypothetical protein [Defluviitaleaceae bacterium]